MLTNTRIKALKPKAKPYQVFDGGGLCIEVLPTGKKVWRVRYRLKGKPEKLTLGHYPHLTLLEARKALLEARGHLAKGVSPLGKREASRRSVEATVEAFSALYLGTLAADTSHAHNTARMLAKDILPFIGSKPLGAVNAGDVLAICDRIKARGAYQVALLARNILKRLYDFAIARQKVQFNPAGQVAARYIATAKPRDVALSGDEIAQLLKALSRSRAHPAHRIAIHLLLITLVRKGELIGARWEEIDFTRGEWAIPGARMKRDRPHVVYLSAQARGLFEELKPLSCGSDYVFPSRDSLNKPMHGTTINKSLRALGFDRFTPHDLRRTASTHLHEAGFNADWIEKALAHEAGGIRAVYNKAQYAAQRREMLQWWANYVDAAGGGNVVPIKALV